MWKRPHAFAAPGYPLAPRITGRREASAAPPRASFSPEGEPGKSSNMASKYSTPTKLAQQGRPEPLSDAPARNGCREELIRTRAHLFCLTRQLFGAAASIIP